MNQISHKEGVLDPFQSLQDDTTLFVGMTNFAQNYHNKFQWIDPWVGEIGSTEYNAIIKVKELLGIEPNASMHLAGPRKIEFLNLCSIIWREIHESV